MHTKQEIRHIRKSRTIILCDDYSALILSFMDFVFCISFLLGQNLNWISVGGDFMRHKTHKNNALDDILSVFGLNESCCFKMVSVLSCHECTLWLLLLYEFISCALQLFCIDCFNSDVRLFNSLSLYHSFSYERFTVYVQFYDPLDHSFIRLEEWRIWNWIFMGEMGSRVCFTEFVLETYSSLSLYKSKEHTPLSISPIDK